MLEGVVLEEDVSQSDVRGGCAGGECKTNEQSLGIFPIERPKLGNIPSTLQIAAPSDCPPPPLLAGGVRAVRPGCRALAPFLAA
eukprot:1182394-Prorocentrum_minimum.AAC.1